MGMFLSCQSCSSSSFPGGNRSASKSLCSITRNKGLVQEQAFDKKDAGIAEA
jgi:hypothetical protein